MSKGFQNNEKSAVFTKSPNPQAKDGSSSPSSLTDATVKSSDKHSPDLYASRNSPSMSSDKLREHVPNLCDVHLCRSDRGSQFGSKGLSPCVQRCLKAEYVSAHERCHSYWSASVIRILQKEMLQGSRFIDQTDAHIVLFTDIKGH
jgi:hypothetical protein